MSLPPVIGVTGYKQSGKSTVVEMLAAWGYERAAFATPLKEMAVAVDPFVAISDHEEAPYKRLSWVVESYGWEDAKRFPDVRRLLQRLGTEGVRDHLGDDAWIHAFERTMEPGKRYAVADLRFPNEAKAVRRWGGMVWRVLRPGTSSDGHSSERCVDEIDPDRLVPNTGTLDHLSISVALAMAHFTAPAEGGT